MTKKQHGKQNANRAHGISFMSRIAVLVLLSSAVSLLSSCSLFKPEARTLSAGDMPASYSVSAVESGRSDRWWEDFEDPELTGLIEEALSGNFTVKEAWARLRQAQAAAVKTGAARYPDLFISAGASTARKRTDTGGIANTATVKDYSLGVASSYEIDLWGGIKAETEAVRLTSNATREDVQTAAMTVAAEVTETWIDIITQRKIHRLLEDQLRTNETYLELIDLRYRKSMASALDVFQQKQVVEKIAAEIPLVEENEELLRHEIALLLGKQPKAPLSISRKNLPSLNEPPETGLPADLLSTRPDIRAARLRLEAADWYVTAARADKLPTISLSASANFGAADLDLLFDNWIMNLAANLLGPIFDGKKRSAEVDRTRAVVDEKLSAYRRTVLTAVKEVEDALVSEAKARQYIDALTARIETARKTRDEARRRYMKGLENYLTVLNQLLTLQELEISRARKQGELLSTRVTLYRALGGTWTDQLTPDGMIGKTGE